MTRPFCAVEARAPAKVILAGEHAVVYGRPALAVPVRGVTARARVQAAPRGRLVHAPDIGLRADLADLAPEHPLRRTLEAVAAQVGPLPRLRVHIASDIPVAAGMGSGAAVTVALARALLAFLGASWPVARLNALAYEIEKLYHGTPSGIDNTVIAYERPIVYRKGHGWRPLRVARPVPLVVADTGQRASTRVMVARVRQGWQRARARYEALFDAVAQAVRAAQDALAAGDLAALGRALGANHALLRQMGVSTPGLDRLVRAAEAAGAYGAKLAGAGGGGVMLAVTAPHAQAAVAQALHQAGAARVMMTTLPPTDEAP